MKKLFPILLITALVIGLIAVGCSKSAQPLTTVAVPLPSPPPITTSQPTLTPTFIPTPTPVLVTTPPPTPTPAPTPTLTLTPTPAPAALLNIAGTWIGSNNQTSGVETVVFSIEQSGVSFNGTWNTSRGTVGKVSGILNGNTANFTITANYSGIIGDFVATGIIEDPKSSQPTMTFSYEGILRGVKQTGAGKVQKQK
jgi:hypothetical protein